MSGLNLGVWGSFTAPRSRALGGKSGMTRATPLVLNRPGPLHFADTLHLVFLVLLSAFLWFASLPPFRGPQVPPFIQEHICRSERVDPIEYLENWVERELCATAGADLSSEARGGRIRASGAAARAGASEERHEERATARAAGFALTSL